MIVVLMYHDVRPSPLSGIERWTVTPARLREHLETLLAAGLGAVSVAAAEAPGPVGIDGFCVTFDDAFASFADHAVPVLQDLGVPATVFVPTAHVGDRAAWLSSEAGALPLLTWDELRQLSRDGIDVGAHGRTHRALDLLSAGELVRELEESRSELENQLHCPCVRMAYPYGEHSRKVRDAVVRAGFSAGYAIGELPSLTPVNLVAIPRLTGWQHLDGGRLLQRARARRRGPAHIYQVARSRTYRWVRRARTAGLRAQRPADGTKAVGA